MRALSRCGGEDEWVHSRCNVWEGPNIRTGTWVARHRMLKDLANQRADDECLGHLVTTSEVGSLNPADSSLDP